jgi:flagellar assembly protein FliH
MLKLEVFETSQTADPSAYLDPVSAKKMHDLAFEQGYGAGWQDALDQMRDEDALRRAATFEALQALSFTYAEARKMAEAQLSGIVHDLLAKILPEVCALSLPGRVAQELKLLLARDLTAPLQILCAPDCVALLGAVLDDLPPGARVTLLEEPSYSAAQVSIQGQGQRRLLDLASVSDTLRGALSAELKPGPAQVRALSEHGERHG